MKKKVLLTVISVFCLMSTFCLFSISNSSTSIRMSVEEPDTGTDNLGGGSSCQLKESRANGTGDLVADAGPDLFADQGDTVTLNGSSSAGGEGNLTYNWTFVYNGTERELTGKIVNFTFHIVGIYNITLNVTDEAGNCSVDTLEVTVRDTEEPVADAGADREVSKGDTVTFNGSGSTDNVGVVNWTWTIGGNTTLYDRIASHTFEVAGEFAVILNVSDMAGNWALDTVSINVADTADPRAVIAQVPNKITVNETIEFDATASEPSQGAVIDTYHWNLTRFNVLLWNSTGKAVNYTFPEWGIYEMTVDIDDSANGSSTASVTILVGDLVNISEIRAELPENGSVLVEFNEFIESYWEGIIDVEWMIEFDSMETVASKVVKVSPGDLGTVNQTYSRAGEYNLSLDISTVYGTFIQHMQVEIVDQVAGDNQLPMAVIKLPEGSIHEHQETTFDGSGSSDPDGGELTYAWDFGDGGTGTGPTVKHTYTEVGEYNITLTVTDVNGSSNSTKIMIKVDEDPTYFADEGEPKDWSIEIKEKWNRTYGEYDLEADRDEDGDGIPNYEDGDIDGDSYSNLDEVEKGSDPTDKDSIPTQKKKSEDTNCTLLIVLLVIFGVILLLMIAIYTRGRGGQEQKTVHYTKEEDFF